LWQFFIDMLQHNIYHHATWIPSDTVLEGYQIRLIPMRYEHLDTLVDLGNDERIWAVFPSSRSNPDLHRQYLEHRLVEMQHGLQHAFCIQLMDTGQIAGTTRLTHLDQENRQLEVGSWLHPDFWRSGINTISKFLLLQFCFETLQTVRVQFRTDVKNERSRQALEKMGATQEGIFRNERIREDGTTRDAVFYSIIQNEWPDIKQRLQLKIHAYPTLPAANTVVTEGSILVSAEESTDEGDLGCTRA
jgi:N-acetyltransferase